MEAARKARASRTGMNASRPEARGRVLAAPLWMMQFGRQRLLMLGHCIDVVPWRMAVNISLICVLAPGG